mmetsp:Transcript_22059/g.52220  ORF Transcript_22059/g.52220 Transcript_22059/m.52220 type:complete len:556 (-) Transcript_22059:8-1675(-)
MRLLPGDAGKAVEDLLVVLAQFRVVKQGLQADVRDGGLVPIQLEDDTVHDEATAPVGGCLGRHVGYPVVDAGQRSVYQLPPSFATSLSTAVPILVPARSNVDRVLVAISICIKLQLVPLIGQDNLGRHVVVLPGVVVQVVLHLQAVEALLEHPGGGVDDGVEEVVGAGPGGFADADVPSVGGEEGHLGGDGHLDGRGGVVPGGLHADGGGGRRGGRDLDRSARLPGRERGGRRYLGLVRLSGGPHCHCRPGRHRRPRRHCRPRRHRRVRRRIPNAVRRLRIRRSPRRPGRRRRALTLTTLLLLFASRCLIDDGRLLGIRSGIFAADPARGPANVPHGARRPSVDDQRPSARLDKVIVAGSALQRKVGRAVGRRHDAPTGREVVEGLPAAADISLVEAGAVVGPLGSGAGASRDGLEGRALVAPHSISGAVGVGVAVALAGAQVAPLPDVREGVGVGGAGCCGRNGRGRRRRRSCLRLPLVLTLTLRRRYLPLLLRLLLLLLLMAGPGYRRGRPPHGRHVDARVEGHARFVLGGGEHGAVASVSGIWMIRSYGWVS